MRDEPPGLSPALGNYAAGDRFWDREHEVGDITAYLADGQSVLLTGPRRVGKTSVVHRVLAGLNPSTRTVFVDLEQYADPIEMFAALAAAARDDEGSWRKVRQWFGRRLGDAADRLEKVDLGVVKVELQAAMAGSWRDDARAVVEALAERPTVVAMDELPLLVNRIAKRDVAEVELLMGLLRGLAGDLPNLRWLISGSIGLEPILHGIGLTGLITYLRSYTIDAWDEATTTGAVEALARTAGLQLEAGVAPVVFGQLGLGVPYHIQLLVDEVRRDATRRGDLHVTQDDVRRVYRGPFLTSAVRAHLLHLETRLRAVLGEGDALRLALDLLTQAAVAEPLSDVQATLLAEDLVEDVERRPAILREVLEILEHDVYLGRGADGWRYRSRLVRDWWQQRNRLGFIPAESRKPKRAMQ